MKHIYIGLVTLSLMLSIVHHAEAQRRRSHGGAVDVAKVIEEAEALHRAYAFGDAIKQVERAISTLSRQRKAIPQELASLKERIEQAERLLSRTERLSLLSVERIPTTELSNYLQSQIPGLNESIRIDIGPDGAIVSSDFISPIGNSGLYAKRVEGQGYDLISAEHIEKSHHVEEVIETAIEGNINTSEDENFPYLMPDGVTLIFGRLSSQGIGGYDLYMSRYNWHRNTYLEPSILGMPFNSPSNDYLLIYDDKQEICLLVSDRDCSEGQVAVFKIDGLSRALSSQVENSAEVELSPEETLAYACLTQELSQPSKSIDIETAQLPIIAERNLYHFGISEIRTAKGRESAKNALRIYEDLELMRQRQHQIRQSYRQNPSNREELSPQLNMLEQDIMRLLSRYEAAVQLVRKAERP